MVTALLQEMLDQGGCLAAVSAYTDTVLSMVTEVLMCPMPMDPPQAATVKIRCVRLVRALQLLSSILSVGSCMLCSQTNPSLYSDFLLKLIFKALCSERIHLRVAVVNSIDVKTCMQLLDYQFDNNAIALHCFGSSEGWTARLEVGWKLPQVHHSAALCCPCLLRNWKTWGSNSSFWHLYCSEAGADVVLATLDLMSQLKTRPTKGRKKSTSEMPGFNAQFLQVLQVGDVKPDAEPPLSGKLLWYEWQSSVEKSA